MRPAFPLLALTLYAPAVFAQDAAVAYLAKQLRTAKDVRVRAQTAVILGGTQKAKSEAVAPLCDGLKDVEAVVRSAAANALGDLGEEPGLACVKLAMADDDANVKSAARKALEKLSTPPVPPGSLYFNVDQVRSDVGDDASALADQLLRQKLSTLGGRMAPLGESKATASALVKARKLRGFLLRPQIKPGNANGLKLEVLVMSYPDQVLQGTFDAKASGGKRESQIKAMVSRVIDEAADELSWKER